MQPISPKKDNVSEMVEGKSVDILLKYYELKQKEIDRYRDYEWRITAWVIGLLMALHAITNPIYLIGKIVYIMLFSLITIGACSAIHFCHKRLEESRKLRSKLEEQCLMPILDFLPESARFKRAPSLYTQYFKSTHFIFICVIFLTAVLLLCVKYGQLVNLNCR